MVKHMDPCYCCINQESLLSYPHGSLYCLSQLFYQRRNFLIVKHMVPLLLLNKLGNLYCTTHMLSSIVLQIVPPYCYHTCFFPHAIIHTLHCLHYLGNFFPFLVVYCLYLIKGKNFLPQPVTYTQLTTYNPP